jgi:NAD(P)H dehydrogenase (quinone)
MWLLKTLVVIAHPIASSFCQTLAKVAIEQLWASSHEVRVDDLYAQEFAPALTTIERSSYYSDQFQTSASASHIANLLWCEAIVVVFPTWWFGFPAMLKGWFDRIWAPGIAYSHDRQLGSIHPKLHGLRFMLAVTTLGSPKWIDRFIYWHPTKRILKYAILRACAPQCRLQFISIYKSERLRNSDVEKAKLQVKIAVAALR